MRDQSSPRVFATVYSRGRWSALHGVTIYVYIYKEKVGHFGFHFSRPSVVQYNQLTSFVKFSFDFYTPLAYIYIYINPYRRIEPREVDVADDGEKTFNWGEKRENWKNYSDKGTRRKTVGAAVQRVTAEGSLHSRPCASVPGKGRARGQATFISFEKWQYGD